MCDLCRSPREYVMRHSEEFKMPHEEQVRVKKKGDAAKYRLKDGMMVTVEKPVLLWNTEMYLSPGMIGIVYKKASPQVTYNPTSEDPNKRRTTGCLVDYTDPNTGITHRCSPTYDNIVILPKKGSRLTTLNKDGK